MRIFCLERHATSAQSRCGSALNVAAKTHAVHYAAAATAPAGITRFAFPAATAAATAERKTAKRWKMATLFHSPLHPPAAAAALNSSSISIFRLIGHSFSLSLSISSRMCRQFDFSDKAQTYSAVRTVILFFTGKSAKFESQHKCHLGDMCLCQIPLMGKGSKTFLRTK